MSKIVDYFQKKNIISGDDRKVLFIGLTYLWIVLIVFLSLQMKGTLFYGGGGQIEVGKPAPSSIILQQDFSYIDQETTQLKQDVAAMKVPPVFEIDPKVTEGILEKYDLFTGYLIGLLMRDAAPEAIHEDVNNRLPGVMTVQDVLFINERTNREALLDELRFVYQKVLDKGVVKADEENLNQWVSAESMVEIWHQNNQQKIRRRILFSDLIQRDHLHDYLTREAEVRELTPKETSLLIKWGDLFIRANCFYQKEKTEAHRETARREVPPVTVDLSKGDILLRKGYLVTEENINKLKQVRLYYSRHNRTYLLGVLLLLLVVAALGRLLYRILLGRQRLSRQHLIIFLVFIAIEALIAVVGERFPFLPPEIPVSLFIPGILFSGIITQLDGQRSGVLFVFTSSLVIFVISGLESFPFLYLLLSGLLTVVVLLQAARRIQLIQGGLLISLASFFIVICLSIMLERPFSESLRAAVAAVAASLIMSMMNLGLLPLFEHFLNIPTRFSLLELTDINAPLLKKMQSSAPGTFSHSMSVANLAQAACENIGADGVLARVGAYYHDIGKIDQSNYFTENQQESNRHDDLKPTLSAAIIRSHVKVGVEKARQVGLPKPVVDIIAQHHGKSVMAFFYDKAMKDGEDNNTSEEDFSYPGPSPQTKEAAVVMLADAVEAATRTLKNPTYSRLEKYVWNLITNRFKEGTLSECDLTFRDLEIIRNTFVQVLAGYFHNRVAYPEKKGE